MIFEYSRWDGSQQFTPQSADAVFDQLAEYLMDYGDHVLDNLPNWEEEHPEVLEMLIKRGLIEKDREGKFLITPKGLKRIENKALDALLDVRGKDKLGRHDTDFRGPGQTVHDDSKPYEYGDPVSNLNLQETLRNALARQGGGTPVRIAEEDLVIYDTEYQTSCATVVLVDMSGSMMRYGKFGAAKRVAMALAALVRSKYQGDWLQTVGFYSYASPLSERELLHAAPKPVSIFDSRVHLRIDLDHPPRFVPEHFTNIHAGLQFARRLLRRQPAQNKQIVLITDGEPTAHVEGRQLLLIYPPAEKTAAITLAEAKRCADEGIHVSSFALIEDYFYLGLVNFVEQLAQVTGGISATVNAQDMGNLVVQSFIGGRRKKQRA
jgi:Ca-activated chloride channel family protein